MFRGTCYEGLQNTGNWVYSVFRRCYLGLLSMFVYIVAILSSVQATINSSYKGIVWHTTTAVYWIFSHICNCVWYFVTNIFSVLHFAFNMVFLLLKLAIAAIVIVIIIYLGIILYRFFNQRHFALQSDFYFGPTPANNPQGPGQGGVLTITPVILHPEGQGRAWAFPLHCNNSIYS